MKLRNALSPFNGGGRTTKTLAFVVLPVLSAVGCSGGGELTKKQDDELRNNFTRKLTPEEIARLGGGKPATPPEKGGQKRP